MQKIKLWSVESSGSRKATAVADIDTTETEQQLEDLLVNSPDLLMDKSHPRWASIANRGPDHWIFWA